MEIWRDIAGYEGFYQVSNFGRVLSLARVDITGHPVKERILRHADRKRRYRQVALCKDGQRKDCLVPRLVATAFIPNPCDLPEVNHKDEYTCNDYADNLEWCTKKYNMNYGTAIERRVRNTDQQAKVRHTDYKAMGAKRAKPIKSVEVSTGEETVFASTHDAERAGFDRSHILNCLKGKYQQHKGYTWQYAEAL
jgi:hypothetical protein